MLLDISDTCHEIKINIEYAGSSDIAFLEAVVTFYHLNAPATYKFFKNGQMSDLNAIKAEIESSGFKQVKSENQRELQTLIYRKQGNGIISTVLNLIKNMFVNTLMM